MQNYNDFINTYLLSQSLFPLVNALHQKINQSHLLIQKLQSGHHQLQTMKSKLLQILEEDRNIKQSLRSYNDLNKSSLQNIDPRSQINSTVQDRIIEKIFGFSNFKFQISLVTKIQNIQTLYKQRNFNIETKIIGGESLTPLGDLPLKISLFTADQSNPQSLDHLLIGNTIVDSNNLSAVFKKLKIKEKSSDFIYHKFILIVSAKDKNLNKIIKPAVIKDVIVKSKRTNQQN